MIEYVWALPRVLTGEHPSDPAVFHPYRPGPRNKTDCGVSIGRFTSKMLLGNRLIVERIARPCERCYR